MPKHEEEPRNVVAIIQARMGSRRFPGKVLADLAGRPVLEWVVDAVRRVERVDQIVVATTTNEEDGAIEKWCEESGVHCFRGEPLDVLKRYADCAQAFQASHIVRITADCPMLHSATVEEMLRDGLETRADYFFLDGGFPDGFDCEGFTLSTLVRTHREATLDSEREHVTLYMKAHPDMFSSSFVQPWKGFESFRLTVDEVEDLTFLSKALEILGESGAPQSAEGVLKVAREIPEIREINSHFKRNEGLQKSIEQEEFASS